MTMTDQREGRVGREWELRMQQELLEALEEYRRGKADTPCVFKGSVLGVLDAPGDLAGQEQSAQEKQTSNDTGGMTFVASTEEVDRHGDVVAVSGWKLEAYRKNPVFLWAHDYSRPAIGRCAEVWTASRETHRSPALLAKVEFAPTAFAQEVAKLYRGGYQKGVSVGFRPVQWEERRHPQTGKFLGIRFTEQVLLEVSAAPVPANENAVSRAWRGRLSGEVGLREIGPGEVGLDEILRVLREARAGP